MATDPARGKVVGEKQPFGFVRESNMMGPGLNGKPTRNSLGVDTMVENRGANHPASMADKNPGAYAAACMHKDNPFYWTGLKEPKSNANSGGPWNAGLQA